MAAVDVADLLEQADMLGEVYLRMLGKGEKLDAKDNIKPKADHVESRILIALSERSEGSMHTDRLEVDYMAAFHSVKRQLQAKAAEAGCEVLSEQMRSLTQLRTRLREGTVPIALTDVAVRVRDRLGGYVPSAEDEATTARIYGPRYVKSTSVPDAWEQNPRFDGGLQIVYRRRVKAALAAELLLYRKPVDSTRPRSREPARTDERARRQRVVDLSTVLSVHPAFAEIFEAYAKSQDEGAGLADRIVREATTATGQLFVDLLVSPDMAWRYPPFVLLGVKRLQLDLVEGFPEYAVALAAVISEPWYKVPLNFLGITIALVGFFLAGPAGAAGGAGAAAMFSVGIADFATTGLAAAVAFMEEREQDVAAVSSSFNVDKLAEPPRYLETALGAAAALICGIGAVFYGVRAFKALRGLRKTPPHPPLDPIGNRLVASPQRRATSAAANRLLRPSPARVPQRARFADRGLPSRTPPRATRGGMGAEDQALAATGTGGRGDVPPDRVSQGPSSAEDPAGPGGGGSGSSPPKAPAPPAASRPGSSGVDDSSFAMTPTQRQYGGTAPWKYAEEQVGIKLKAKTRLPMLPQESNAALTLSRQGGSPKITGRYLLKEPIITHPDHPELVWDKKRLQYKAPPASAKPDYMYMTPDQIEVFEATLDVRFQIRPVEPDLWVRGTAQRWGDPHKVIQLWKAEYLMRRYPDMRIVYNIQSVGQVPRETLERIKEGLAYLKNVRAEVGGTGSIQIILRADTTHVLP
jgi:hypothetical protein